MQIKIANAVLCVYNAFENKGECIMLLQFDVTNYLSFKNEMILDLTANKDSEHKENLIKFKNKKILPVISIYGANAAGKSNINKALTFAIMFVRQSNLFQVNSLIPVIPFLLDDESRFQKTKFDFVFTYQDVKYEYGFVIDSQKVYEEYLYEYTSQRPTAVFERENVNQYKFSAKYKKELMAVVERNTDNKLFLATATQWNCLSTRNAYMWFSEGIDTYDDTNLENNFVSKLEVDNDDSTQKFMRTLLQNADLNIDDYEFEIKNADPDKIQLPMGIKFDENTMRQIRDTYKEWRLETHHKVNVDGTIKDYKFPIQQESKGTINFFYFGPVFLEALKKGKTIVIDEIDSGLHPKLVRYLIEIFNNPSTNPNHAQLIFNTHDITQLDLDVFRRDQIYFVEKNNTTGISDLYSLDEYSPRKSENIQKGYLQGRYGAIPAIGMEEIKW